MLRPVERVERGELAEESRQVLLLEPSLLEEVGHRGGEGEHEQGDAEDVGRDVDRQEASAGNEGRACFRATRFDARRNVSASGATKAPTTSIR